MVRGRVIVIPQEYSMSNAQNCPPTYMLKMTRGETRRVQLTVRLNGVPVNLTGATLEFCAQSFEPHTECRLDLSTADGSITVEDPRSGVATLTINPSDTLPFPNVLVEFDTEWSLTDAFGNVTSVLKDQRMSVGPTLLQTSY